MASIASLGLSPFPTKLCTNLFCSSAAFAISPIDAPINTRFVVASCSALIPSALAFLANDAAASDVIIPPNAF